jgi:hypothetical protein
MGMRRHRMALGPPLPACVLELPNQFLLLRVGADHRISGALMVFDLLIDIPELRIAVRVLLSLNGLGAALQAEPLLPQQVPDGTGGNLWPWRVSSAARLRDDLVVHRSGDIGSPRSSGSTRASSAGRSPRSSAAAFLRPPPGLRARPSGSAPESSSVTPRETVASRTPAARATSRIPSCPSARASAPISSRRCRSSRCGKIARTSPPAPAPLPHHQPYHSSMPHYRKQRVIFPQALRLVAGRQGGGEDGDGDAGLV